MNRQAAILLILIASLIPPVASISATLTSTSSTPLSASINEVKQAFLINATVPNKPVEQGQAAKLAVEVENTGSVDINVSTKVNITNATGSLIDNITSSNTSLAVGEVKLIETTWDTTGHSTGNYTATGIAFFNDGNNTTNTRQANFTVAETVSDDDTDDQPSDDGGGGSDDDGGGGGPPPTDDDDEEEEQPNQTAPEIVFTRSSLLNSFLPGGNGVAAIEVQNIGEAATTVDMGIDGLQPDWYSISPSSFQLEPGEQRGTTIRFSIPRSAPPDAYSYRLFADYADDVASKIGVLRIRQMRHDRPTVLRSIETSTDTNQTTVQLQLTNPTDRTVPRMRFTEEIPKQLASHVSQVRFDPQPTTVIEPDPVVAWEFMDIQPNETHTVSYTVDKQFTDISQAQSWPLREIIVSQTKFPQELQIERTSFPLFTPGSEETAIIHVGNRLSTPRRINLSISPPRHWDVTPKKQSRKVAGNSNTSFRFQITAPTTTQPGNYTVEAFFRFGESLLVKRYPVQVRRERTLPVDPVILLAIALIILGILAVKHREKVL
jgi:hypothetical protein